MARLLAVLFLLACLPAALLGLPTKPKFKRPDFCKDLDCPAYKVEELPGDRAYEARVYAASKWVMTAMLPEDDYNMTALYMRLYDYTHGNNADNVTIPRAVPVLVGVTGDRGDKAQNSTVTSVYFYLGDKLAPEPSHPDVALLHMPKQTFYVRTFMTEVMPTMDEYRKELGILIEDLESSEPPIIPAGEGVLSAYESPMFEGERHNEVAIHGMRPEITSSTSPSTSTSSSTSTSPSTSTPEAQSNE